jgi:CBS domain containing-hemolysin-like protein
MPPKPSSLEDKPPSLFLKNTIPKAAKFELWRAVASIADRFVALFGSKNDAIKIGVMKINKIKKIDSNAKEGEILQNFLTFSTKTVEEAMIPRTDIVAIKHDANLATLAQVVAKTHHTRTLVYEGTLDNIVGFVHIKDLFTIVTQNREFKLKNIIRKPIISAPSMKLNDLLVVMQRQRTHIAVVVDEYGGTDGIVTIEDIIEEIVGRIDDEHDAELESDSYQIIDSSTVISSSRVEVEDLEQILGVKLKAEGDEFDTIGGLVLAKVGYMPALGTKIDISEQVELEVIDANPRTLKTVKLTLKT